jgi:hypothetical protein
VKEFVLGHGRISICEVANMLEILFVSVEIILTDSLNMRCTANKSVSCVLSEEQKTVVSSCARTFKERLERYTEFALKIITGDEMLVYRFDSETKKLLAQM